MPDSTHEKPATQLRVEAGPAKWTELDSAQCTAYLKLAGMVSEALSPLPSRGTKDGAKARLRKTQTAFVMGGRGTGKTTVLETLRSDSLNWSETEPPATASAMPAALRQERDALLRNITGRLVWLETLDMEPLPTDANLLAAILVRLEDAARTYGVKEGQQSERSRGLLEPSSDYHAALLELQRLQTDVALAWDGNLRERKGQLDPDTYAVEMMRIEQARLSLNRRFAETFDGLAENVFHTTRVHNPMFVLPVDDFDLNPPTCLNLLRVLRMISIPRLFTIVLGDLQVAQTVLSLKLSHDIGTIADARIHRDMLAIDTSSVGVLAGDVAANAIRKLLPPTHRVVLHPMDVWEALNFRPLGTDGEPRLHELFAQCPVYVQWNLPRVSGVEPSAAEKRNGASLRQLLMAPPLVSAVSAALRTTVRFEEAAAVDAVYSGRLVVEAPPRRVADMWLGVRGMSELAHVDEEDASDQLLTHFAEVCRGALQETSLFTPDERRYIDRAIDRTGGVWTLRALPILISAETTPATPVDIAERSKTRLPSAVPRILLFEALDWRISVPRGVANRRPGSQAGTGGLGSGLPPGLGPDPWEQQLPAHALAESTTSALIMYHDLLTLTRSDGSFVTPLLTPANLRIDWAATEWRVARRVRFDWPAPPVPTFFDLDCLKAAWNLAIKSPEIAEARLTEKVERLLFAWISIGTAVLTRQPAQRLSSRSEPLAWKALTKNLEALVDSHDDAHREWLIRVCEILMPEVVGTLPLIAAKFGKTLPGFWRSHRTAIIQRRVDRLVELSSDRELIERLLGLGLAEGFKPPPFLESDNKPPMKA